MPVTASEVAAVIEEREAVSGIGREFKVRWKASAKSEAPSWVHESELGSCREAIRRFHDLQAARTMFSSPAPISHGTKRTQSGEAGGEHVSPPPTKKARPDGDEGVIDLSASPRQDKTKTTTPPVRPAGGGASVSPSEPVGSTVAAKTVEVRTEPVVSLTSPRSFKGMVKKLHPGATEQPSSKPPHSGPPASKSKASNSPRSLKAMIRNQQQQQQPAAAATTSSEPKFSGSASVSSSTVSKPKSSRPLFRREDSQDFVVVQRNEEKRAPLTSHQRDIMLEQKVHPSAERVLLDHATATSLAAGGDSQSLFGDRTQQTQDDLSSSGNFPAAVPARFRLNRSSDKIRESPVDISFKVD